MTISIITATYNSEAYLQKTIDSLLSQTYTDWEHIIVDGESRDNTVAIIEQNEAQYAGRLHWISEHDNGLYEAINKGIKMAKGEVIGILNSDDFYSNPHVLEHIAAAFHDTTSMDAVYGDVTYINAQTLQPKRLYTSRYFRPWKMRMGYMPAHPSFYCKTECYTKYGYYDASYRIAGDFELLLRMIFVGHIHTQYLPMQFVSMREGGVSSSGVQSHLLINKEHLKALHNNHIYSNILFLSIRYIRRIVEWVGDQFRYLF